MKDNVRSGMPLSLMQQSICRKRTYIHDMVVQVAYLMI